ncbi:PhzF family phenazine biosynthesis protein [Ureibacillus terrenus]|uniref:PhzF family phenazine biosynthesis protein n=1 Tax=Ureibacillus terrenus TaxID=118246 RepID=A0A540V5I7_9BACL|nr:PhzF family phenazine biosynthesis protein [Ureibacillus terrenus]MED3661229.1 PhzF family phenazine biosynthesis protein [Ureibacillus terrenus]MED3764296.1 PhzF family phenazine biosynthesis protein [Ureibacillus terrenus]TQE92019.1 PhzF family phenazine biosynthesis protein [Ureibacillus terrenus]
MKELPIYQIDAFTGEPFKGNPAAVVVLDEWLPDEIMQQIAMENNLSETAFVVHRQKGEYELRWFTPKTEIDLCGHATLAAAFAVFNYLEPSVAEVRFHTKSGLLTVVKEGSLLVMTFPSREGEPCEMPEALVKGLGKKPKEVYLARDYLAVFETEEEIRNLEIDLEELKKLDAFGVIATAKGNGADFVSRFFAPKAGIDEDPVTGSAHCTLVPYWKKMLRKEEFVALQLSPRGGKLYCKDLGMEIQIGGEAVVYMEGKIYV